MRVPLARTMGLLDQDAFMSELAKLHDKRYVSLPAGPPPCALRTCFELPVCFQQPGENTCMFLAGALFLVDFSFFFFFWFVSLC